jgi:hypothetical protein
MSSRQGGKLKPLKVTFIRTTSAVHAQKDPLGPQERQEGGDRRGTGLQGQEEEGSRRLEISQREG